MKREWHYSSNGTEHGPITGAELKALAQSGTLQPVDLVWKEGMQQRKPAGTVKGLFPERGVGQRSPARAKTPAKDRPRLVKKPTGDPARDSGPSAFANLDGPADDSSADISENDSVGSPHGRGKSRPKSERSPGTFTPKMLLLGGVIGIIVLIGLSATVMNVGRPGTPAAADEEFRIAASHKGQAALNLVQTMIDLRRDRQPWWQLEDLVDSYGDYGIKTEFNRWKRDRIAAGDRYK
jgi:hypothetical protein